MLAAGANAILTLSTSRVSWGVASRSGSMLPVDGHLLHSSSAMSNQIVSSFASGITVQQYELGLSRAVLLSRTHALGGVLLAFVNTTNGQRGTHLELGRTT